MIRFEAVGVRYDGAPRPVLRDVSFEVAEGELVLVVGETGSGKSTLLGTVNGLVPRFSGGQLTGRVVVAGVDVRTRPPRELADVVGVVGQDPLAGFVTDTVEEELAYGMEQLAVPPAAMRRRVEETLDLLGIAELRGRPLRELSGGQQQRVAIGAVLAADPRVLVLDEPTSALDPTAAEEVLSAVARLVHDLGVTVLMAEHRLERVVQYADRVLHLPGDGRAVAGSPADVLAATDLAPPVVRLGRLAGWRPPPVTVRDARRLAGPLRERLVGAPATVRSGGSGPVELTATGVWVRYGQIAAVAGADLQLRAGEVTALMGRNGSGKSSLLWALQGSLPRAAGRVDVRGVDPGRLSAREARRRVGLVPQTAADLLYLETVRAECTAADREAGCPAGTTRAWLDRLLPGVDDDRHPRDLSEGQRLALVLAVQTVAAPRVVLLDEPTRGLDAPAKRRFARAVRALAGRGSAVVVATHDVELVAELADRVVVLAGGEVVSDGPTAEVVASSPAFAPQVAKILAPQPWLTVDQVAEALQVVRR